MSNPLKKNTQQWTMESVADYVSKIVVKKSGNILGEKQRSMVVSRLKKRLLDLGGLTPDAYYAYFCEHQQIEVDQLVSLLTTHHTFFFREFCHFEYVLRNLTEIVERVKARGDKKIRVLCAACSRGQEVYSLGMFLHKHLQSFAGVEFEILGTDIDHESIKIAKNGVYPYNDVKEIPQVYLQGNWQKGTGAISEYAKIKEHIKSKCDFKVMNLLESGLALFSMKFDIIFCRNVFIYFDTQTTEKIVKDFQKYLYEDAIFITGLSESLGFLDIPKQTLGPNVYNFTIKETPTLKVVGSDTEKAIPQSLPVSKPSASPIPHPMRVLVVDDSSSVVKLMSMIFENDDDFILAGTATNGEEAAEFLKNNKVDAMTLDIHMPELDGVSYLKKYYRSGHPNVVIVSSASREDNRYAQEALTSGASDFVEKPALNNLGERSEEIKNKLKMSFLTSGPVKISSVDKAFGKDFCIDNPEAKARAFVAAFSDLKKVKQTLKELKGNQPPTFILSEGNLNILNLIADELMGPHHVEVYDGESEFRSNTIYVCDFKEHSKQIHQFAESLQISLSVFGICSEKIADWVTTFKKCQLLLEDVPGINNDLKEVATDIFPWTSFAHIGTEYLAKD
jgi:chemotaxis protein methyltransferase CheR